ncbi:MAG TPA: type I DNA topoisomerase [Coleofasciculaceae cyanobacterium]|jgi:DNA topoisomerase-1
MAKTAKTTTKTKKASPKKAAAKDVILDDDDLEGGGSGRSLVIVESPAKAKTLKKILGNKFIIKASVGHIRDLPEKKLGVDIEHDFEPVYEVLPAKADLVEELQQAARKSDIIYLAADPDREGEAIAWHVSTLLDNPKAIVHRIEFHEITKTAILEAIQHPREIDIQRVNAQQTRRILDRLVGYKLSPLLWKKVSKGLSAGRVQSVAVRLICEREAEIEAFVPVEYWTIAAELKKEAKAANGMMVNLVKINGEKAEIHNQDESDKLLKILQANPYEVASVNTRESRRKPQPPFITSTLQRESSTRYGYSVKKTMQIAQQLYEGVELGSGPEGLISYMRTDSTRISDEARDAAKEFIEGQYGKEFYPAEPNDYSKKNKKGVQDAHEAIRPTMIERTPDSVRQFLNDEQFRIYSIVWNRFMASQMEAAVISTKSVEVACDNLTLRGSDSKVVFKGYLAVYQSDEDEEVVASALLDVTKGDKLVSSKIEPKQHFTEPPPRYNEASLVKMLEELGIGRPSTYAPTIATVQDRGYVYMENKALKPTPLGRAVNEVLVKHFQDIVDVNFTAAMETKLDDIEHDALAWRGVIREFYEPFEATLKKASDEMEKVVILLEGETCPDCEKPMSLKTSRWGSQFMGCTGYPECKFTRPLSKDQKALPEDKPSDEKCEKCSGEMMLKHGRFGEYLKCQNEDCGATKSFEQKTGVTCPKCGEGEVVAKKSKRGKMFYGCNRYPKCDQAFWNKPVNEKCPDCGAMLTEKTLKKGTFHACSEKGCGYSREVEQPAAAEA